MCINRLRSTPSDATLLEVPPELLDSVMRHQAHLAGLVASLRAAGLHENVVEASVRTLIDSYADELTIAIRGMVESDRHG